MSNIKQLAPAALENSQLYKLGEFDSANRAWPLSYWKAAKTLKFAKWLAVEHPDLFASI